MARAFLRRAVLRVRRGRRRRRRGDAPPHRRCRRDRASGRAGRGRQVDCRSATRLQDQRPRHLQRARGGAAFRDGDPRCSTPRPTRSTAAWQRSRCRARSAATRYADASFGIDEDRPLDFHSPYGCSKGAGDQYARDYARIYGLRTVVFRQSLHLRHRQFGGRGPGLGRLVADRRRHRQADHASSATASRSATCSSSTTCSTPTTRRRRADRRRRRARSSTSAAAPPTPSRSGANSVRCSRTCCARESTVSFHPWRAGDQKIYVSDIAKAARILGWAPRTTPRQGMERLHAWIVSNRALFV